MALWQAYLLFVALATTGIIGLALIDRKETKELKRIENDENGQWGFPPEPPESEFEVEFTDDLDGYWMRRCGCYCCSRRKGFVLSGSQN